MNKNLFLTSDKNLYWAWKGCACIQWRTTKNDEVLMKKWRIRSRNEEINDEKVLAWKE